jgi:predicted enzyme related to lactoylglutathione lyase
MKISYTTIYVDDQDKALKFYTEVLGFVKKADVSAGSFRWLTVATGEDPDGIQLQLAASNSPVAKAYQQGLYRQNQPAIMLNTGDVDAEYQRAMERGAQFKTRPTHATGSKIAVLEDTCGNLVQLTQLMEW